MLWVLLGTVLGGYLAICGLVFAGQRRLLFPAPVELAPTPQRLTRVEVAGGSFLLWRPVPGDGPVVVHFHGNGEQVAHLAWLADEWAARGVSFAAVEYPGYPGAAGSPSETSIVAASEAALVHLTSVMQIARSRLVLVGQSLGTGVVMTLAARGWGTRLVLLSPYTSLPDVAAEAFPWLPVRLLMLDRFDSASRAGNVAVPALLIHGTRDEVIPFALGLRLSGLLPGARFLPVEGAHHNDLWDGPHVAQAVFAR